MNNHNNFDFYDINNFGKVLSDSSYKTANPFPHIIIDNFFYKPELLRLVKEWSVSQSNPEVHNDREHVRHKLTTPLAPKLPLLTTQFLQSLNQPLFLEFLENLTGIGGLIPDPYFFGGGLHETMHEGFLAIHADFNKHFKYNLDRRLNLLIYLNESWTDENGGHLELWDSKMLNCDKKILPIFNRMVIFSTTDTSFHGQPSPVNSVNQSRKSIAIYYYSNGRREENSIVKEHSTIWKI